MAEIPDIYTDSVAIASNVWGFTLSFGTRPLEQATSDEHLPGETKVRIRMGHGHAKVLAMMMRRVVKQHEDRIGEPVKIPDGVMEALGLQDADW